MINTTSLRFSEYNFNDYSTYKATANKTPSSTNRVVAAMQITAYKVAAAFRFAATFLSNMALSIANLAIRAANFTHGRIFTKEAPAVNPVEINQESETEVVDLNHIDATSAPIDVTSAPIDVTSAPIDVTSAPIDATSAPIDATSAAAIDSTKEQETALSPASSPLKKAKERDLNKTLNYLNGLSEAPKYENLQMALAAFVATTIISRELIPSALIGVLFAALATVGKGCNNLIIGKATQLWQEQNLKNKKEAPAVVNTQKNEETSPPSPISPPEKEKDLIFVNAASNALKLRALSGLAKGIICLAGANFIVRNTVTRFQ